MHLSVVHEYPDVTCIRTGKRSLCHLVHDTLKDSRHETCIDGTTDYAVVELQLSAPVKIIRLLALHVQRAILSVDLEFVRERNTFHDRAYKEMNLSELTCTTGLFLVTTLGGSNLGNGLTIWNLRREELYLNLELILETPFDHVYMLLSLTT